MRLRPAPAAVEFHGVWSDQIRATDDISLKLLALVPTITAVGISLLAPQRSRCAVGDTAGDIHRNLRRVDIVPCVSLGEKKHSDLWVVSRAHEGGRTGRARFRGRAPTPSRPPPAPGGVQTAHENREVARGVLDLRLGGRCMAGTCGLRNRGPVPEVIEMIQAADLAVSGAAAMAMTTNADEHGRLPVTCRSAVRIRTWTIGTKIGS